MLTLPKAASVRGSCLVLACVVACALVASAAGAGTAKAPYDYAAFGDSWSSGAHCGGCRTFVTLYGDDLAATTHRRVLFHNLTQTTVPGTGKGETSSSLLSDLRSDPSTRLVAKHAEIIVISSGANDLEPAFDAYGAGTCGGSDNANCFRKVAAKWRINFDAILAQIRKLRAGQPTAIRVISNSNEFLADPNFVPFGKDFGRTTGVLITKLMRTALCAASKAHAAVCVPLGPVLNGPHLLRPQDVNTPEAMKAVANALLATGLRELE
jgi:hypothetical protein